MMTGTTNNELALHKVIQMKRFHNLRNYICDESNYPFLSLMSFSFCLFIHHLRYANRITSYDDVILQEFRFVTSGKSENPYELLFELVLEIDDECY